jgi:hypothetical protein
MQSFVTAPGASREGPSCAYDDQDHSRKMVNARGLPKIRKKKKTGIKPDIAGFD